jgi:hypothetical protein
VRRFIKDPGHADAYPALKVTFINGKNPDLLLKSADGSIVETIDLSVLTTDEIHQLLTSKGFERNAKGVKSKGH